MKKHCWEIDRKEKKSSSGFQRVENYKLFAAGASLAWASSTDGAASAGHQQEQVSGYSGLSTAQEEIKKERDKVDSPPCKGGGDDMVTWCAFQHGVDKHTEQLTVYEFYLT